MQSYVQPNRRDEISFDGHIPLRLGSSIIRAVAKVIAPAEFKQVLDA